MPILTSLALRLTDFSERTILSAFVIACLLTLATFGMALLSSGDADRLGGFPLLLMASP